MRRPFSQGQKTSKEKRFWINVWALSSKPFSFLGRQRWYWTLLVIHGHGTLVKFGEMLEVPGKIYGQIY